MSKKKNGQCGICYEDLPLIKGHIVPKWTGKLGQKSHMQDMVHVKVTPDNRMINEKGEVSSLERVVSEGKREGLFASYLFCKDCDEKLGRGEGLIRELIHPSGNASGVKMHEDSNGVKNKFSFENKDQEVDFINGCLGIFFKAHCAPEGGYASYKLPVGDVRIIRDAIKHNKINSDRFKLNIIKLYNFSDSEQVEEHAPYNIAAITSMYQHHVIIAGGFLLFLEIRKQKGNKQAKPFKYGIPRDIVMLDISYILPEDRLFDPSGIFKAADDEITGEIFEYWASSLDKWKELCPCYVYYSHIDLQNKKVYNRKPFEDCCLKFWLSEKVLNDLRLSYSE